MNAAEFEREKGLKLLEKAIAEREKNADKDAFPRLEELYNGYSRKLSEQERRTRRPRQSRAQSSSPRHAWRRSKLSPRTIRSGVAPTRHAVGCTAPTAGSPLSS